MAKTVEGFYQESGRAGRDGLPAISILYYSKDDESRFAFIIRKSASSKVGASGKASPHAEERPLKALQKMVDYCIVPSCRRQYLLSHFGEDVDPKVICKKTCDFCLNPEKIQNAAQAALVVKDVLKTSSTLTSKMKEATHWDGQWDQPHGDNVDDCDGGQDCGDDPWMDVDLGITHSSGDDLWEDSLRDVPPQSMGKTGFQTASSILAKYEMLECQEKRSDGFVRFQSIEATEVSTSKPKPVEIPKHLRAGLPDPLGHFNRPPAINNESSTELSERSRKLKENLVRLQAERAEKAAQLKSMMDMTKASSSLLPPPPPTLTFKKARK
jgi:superfamily II DNA helicase RecQ